MLPTFTFPASSSPAFASQLLAVHLTPPASRLHGHLAGAVLVRAADDLGTYVAAFVVDETDRQQMLELQAFLADQHAAGERAPAVGIIARGSGRSDTSAKRYGFQASAMLLQSVGEHQAPMERWLCDLVEAEPLPCS